MEKIFKNNIREFILRTGSKKAKKIFDSFDVELKNFKQVCPIEMLDKLDNPITFKELKSKSA